MTALPLDWLKPVAGAWLERVEQQRIPHAVMLAGPPGVGKRATAAWMASQRLGIGRPGRLPQFPFDRPEHADLSWIEPPEDKQNILIEQIRDLVASLSLTSYEGGGKVAVISPANAMTANAANSLLKTLEEPPGDTLLILVADRMGRLPATIFSRCQRIDLAVPAEQAGLTWLDRFRPGHAWADALRMAGNAPLAALDADEHLDISAGLARDFLAVATGQAAPVEVAARWSKLDTGFVLDWLYRQLKLAIVARSAGRAQAAGLAIEQTVLERMDTRNLFWYLESVSRLRGQPPGSFNVQLAYDALLIDWAAGLDTHHSTDTQDGMRWLTAAR